MKKIHIFLIVLFLVSFGLRIALAFLSPVKYWDETIYANLGRNLILYKEYSFLHGFADFAPDWPLAGFRPPLLPLLVSGISIFTFDGKWLNFIVPLISSLGIILLFLLVKYLSNERIAIFSSLLFSFSSIFIFWGSKLLNDTLLLTFLFGASYFFLRTISEKKTIFGIAFGVFLGLAFLSRYSAIWFFGVIALSIFIFKRSFLKERGFWIGISVFLIVILPWFIFNYINYGEVFGFLNHTQESALRWGKSGFFYYLPLILKVYWPLIPLSIMSGIFYKEVEFKRQFWFFLIWFFVFLLFLSILGHKEERYLLVLLPALCVLTSMSLLLVRKKALYLIFSLLFLIVLSYSVLVFVFASMNDNNECFLKTMNFIKDSEVDAVVTEHFSPVYFYTLKPNIRVNEYNETKVILDNYYGNKTIYYYYSEGDWFDLRNYTLDVMYNCSKFYVYTLEQ